MLEKGTVVFGNWTVEEEIGSGAFGTVYKIKKEEFGRVYYSAMKVLHILAEIRKTDAASKGVGGCKTPHGELLQELVFFILH